MDIADNTFSSGWVVISGRVVDDLGNPVPNAKIQRCAWIRSVWWSREREYWGGRSARTKADGSFRMTPGLVVGVDFGIGAGEGYYEFHETVYGAKPNAYRNVDIVLIRRGPFSTLVAEELLLEYRSDGSGRVGLVYAEPGEVVARADGMGPSVIEYTDLPDVEAAIAAAREGKPLVEGGRPLRAILVAKPKGYQPGGTLETGYCYVEHHEEVWLAEGDRKSPRGNRAREHPRHAVLMVVGRDSGVQFVPEAYLRLDETRDVQVVVRRAPMEGYGPSIGFGPARRTQYTKDWFFVKAGGLHGWARFSWHADPAEAKDADAVARREFERTEGGWTYRLPLLVFVQPDGTNNLEEYWGLRDRYGAIRRPLSRRLPLE